MNVLDLAAVVYYLIAQVAVVYLIYDCVIRHRRRTAELRQRARDADEQTHLRLWEAELRSTTDADAVWRPPHQG